MKEKLSILIESLKKKNFFYFWLPIFIISLIIISFFGVLLLFSVNAPAWDDYGAVLGFANSYISANFLEKIVLLFSQHNEHRIVFTKLVELGVYFLLKEINFKLLIFLGNISLLGLAYFLFRSTSFKKQSLLFFCPVALLLFSYSFWEISYMAMSSISNLWIYFFAFLTLFCISKKKYLFSFIFAVITTFIQGNGMLIFLISIFLLLYLKEHKQAIIMGVLMIFTMFLYFFHYVQPLYHPSIFFGLNHPISFLIYFFSLIGSVIGGVIPHISLIRLLASFFLGIIIFLAFLYISYHKIFKANPLIYSFLLFLFLSVTIVTISRSGFGISQSLSSRYTLLSILILVCMYLLYISLYTPSSKVIGAIIFVCLIINISSFVFNIDEINQRKDSAINGICLWENNFNETNLLYPSPNEAMVILNNSISLGIYSSNSICNSSGT